MGAVRRFFGLEESATVTGDQTRAAAAEAQVEILAEGIADLERALEDTGWQRLTGAADDEFSRPGLARAAKVARVMAIANPLIKRGLCIRQAYVWGQGVQIQARATGENGEQDVNSVVQAFLDDQGNRAAFTGDQAQEELERALGTDGNVFLAAFTNPRTGFVQVRSIPFDEITDVIANPDDKDDPWYYRRQWVQTVVSLDGRSSTQQMVAYYPSLTYRPRTRPKTIDGAEIRWDAPIHHTSVNRLDGWAFGIGDAYAALPYARMYRDFLGDWALLVKALSQFAFQLTGKKGSRAQDLRRAVARRPAGNDIPGNPNSIGGTAVTGPDVKLEAIPKSGATVDSESGRPIASMAAAALGIPVTMLLADPGTAGNRATAETLDKPTHHEMSQRRSLWAETYRSILQYVILQATKAPQGPLKGTVTRDNFTGREVLVLANDTDTTIEIVWPPLDEVPLDVIVGAIVKADGTGKIPPLETMKLLLRALGVQDVDELVKAATDANGRWLDPRMEAAQAALDAHRAQATRDPQAT